MQLQAMSDIGPWESMWFKPFGCERRNIPEDVQTTWDNMIIDPGVRDQFVDPVGVNEHTYGATLALMVRNPKWDVFEDYWCWVVYKRVKGWTATPPERIEAINLHIIRQATPAEFHTIWLCNREEAGIQ